MDEGITYGVMAAPKIDHDKIEDARAAPRSYVASLEEDRKRLDWLELLVKIDPKGAAAFVQNVWHDGRPLREAIDAAHTSSAVRTTTEEP